MGGRWSSSYPAQVKRRRSIEGSGEFKIARAPVEVELTGGFRRFRDVVIDLVCVDRPFILNVAGHFAAKLYDLDVLDQFEELIGGQTGEILKYQFLDVQANEIA